MTSRECANNFFFSQQQKPATKTPCTKNGSRHGDKIPVYNRGRTIIRIERFSDTNSRVCAYDVSGVTFRASLLFCNWKLDGVQEVNTK